MQGIKKIRQIYITYIYLAKLTICVYVCLLSFWTYLSCRYKAIKTPQYTLILLTYMVAMYKQSSYILLTYSMLYLISYIFN